MAIRTRAVTAGLRRGAVEEGRVINWNFYMIKRRLEMIETHTYECDFTYVGEKRTW